MRRPPRVATVQAPRWHSVFTNEGKRSSGAVAGYRLFSTDPDGKFENLKVTVAGDVGTFEWDFVATDANGQKIRTAAAISAVRW